VPEAVAEDYVLVLEEASFQSNIMFSNHNGKALFFACGHALFPRIHPAHAPLPEWPTPTQCRIEAATGRASRRGGPLFCAFVQQNAGPKMNQNPNL
jgi:hypothetical protein